VEPKVIYQDENILVIDKPAGWIVNEAETTKGQKVLQTWLSQKFDYPVAKDRGVRCGIVHRLDKETSGILIVAKTKNVFIEMQRQFKNREVEKSYTALVHGKVEPKEGVIEVPVGRLPWRRDRFGVLPGGREAKTGYKVIRHYKAGEGDYSLLELYPKTGRTHQIRIHLKYIGHPIVADEFYAGRKTARGDRKWCPRLFLHAASVSFFDTKVKKRLRFHSELPEELRGVIATLEKVRESS